MIDELHSKLKTFGQEHLLTGIETLTSSARETYLAALNRLALSDILVPACRRFSDALRHHLALPVCCSGSADAG